MSKLAEYIIPYKGLSEKVHLFDFEINDEFFSLFENSEIEKGALKVQVELDKHSNFIVLTFVIKGSICLTCDRCLEEYSQPIENTEKMVFTLNQDIEFDGEDEISALAQDEELNVAQYIYEYICLQVPYRRVHSNIKECNPDMIKKLNEISTRKVEIKEDPRWDKLKNIITNTKNQ